MTTLYTSNFDSETTGQIASGWTAISGTWEVGTSNPVSGAKTFACTTNTDSQRAVYSAGNSAQTNQSFSCSFVYNEFANSYPCPMVRCGASAGGYVAVLDAPNARVGIFGQSHAGGGFSTLGLASLGTLIAGTPYTLEISAVGTTIEARFYAAGAARPSVATVSTVSTELSAGLPGLYWVKPAGASSISGGDDMVWTDAAASAATAVTLSGPSSGVVGAASSSFTVGADGTITGTVVVTPSDSSGGGSFSPTSVSISSASQTGTFTYTPASAGAKSISVTNNGGLANPSAITYTASSGSTTIDVENSAITWSPYNWDTLQVGDFGVSVKSKQTVCCGAYLKFSVTGTTSVLLALDSSTLSGFGGNTPRLMWSINYGAAQYGQITVGASSLSLATGLTSGSTYTVQVWLLGTVEAQGTRWGSAGVSPTNVLRIQGITVDSGASLSSFPQVRTKRIGFAGDSIVEGVRAAGTTTQPADHGRSAAWFVGQGMGAEYGVMGYGAQAWTGSGSGGIPGFTTAWASHSSGRARDWSGIDYYFVMHGYNGTPSQSAVEAWIAAARAALGAACWIFLVCAPSGRAASVVTAATAAYKAANPADTKVALIDYSDRIEITSYNNGVGSARLETTDGVHPLEFANAQIGAAIVAKAQAAIDAVATSSHPFVVSLGSEVLFPNGGMAVVV